MAESKLQTPCDVVQALLGGHRGAWARSHVTNLGCMLKISYFSESQKGADHKNVVLGLNNVQNMDLGMKDRQLMPLVGPHQVAAPETVTSR